MLKESTFTNGNSKLHYLQNDWKAKRETVIFFHGFPDCPTVWDGLIKYFDESFNLLIPFLPGVHQNCEIQDRLSDRFCLSILLFLEKEKKLRSSLHLVGHDVGGVLADQLSHLIGKRCQSISFISTMGLNLYSKNLRVDQIIKSWYVPIFSTTMGQRLLSRSNKIGKKLLKKMDPTALENQIPDKLGSVKLYREFAKKLYNQNFFKRDNKVKALFLFSSEDPFVQVPPQNAVKNVYPNSTIRVINGGHWEFCQRSEYFSELIIQHIKHHHEVESENFQA